MPSHALLFDFDGVLADTENHHVAAWQRAFVLMGLEEPDDVCARAAEQDDRAFLAARFAHHGIEKGDVEGWVRKKQETTRMLLADSPRLYPGVKALVDRLRGRVALGVVTTTWRENVSTVLDATGLASAFEVVVGKEDVTTPKPDPAPYLEALRRLGVAPAEACAIEDSPGGLASARAAGLRLLAVGHRRPAGEWCEGGVFLPDLKDTDRVVSALGWDV